MPGLITALISAYITAFSWRLRLFEFDAYAPLRRLPLTRRIFLLSPQTNNANDLLKQGRKIAKTCAWNDDVISASM